MTSPNVIVILADDLGYSDPSAFGGEIDTPHLDRLAHAGVRMSSFYATPRCSPSRAALLTGRHPHSVGVGILTTDDRPNGYPGSLSTTAPTVAERLKDHGYATALVGKWHLSSDITTPNETWPTRRGFDEFYGTLLGASSYYNPPLSEGERRREDELPEDYYLTDDLSERAVDFVARSAQNETPFFLYLSYTAPHWPLHAPESVIARYRERYQPGWDELRIRRAERMTRLGLIDSAESLARDPEVPAWEEAADPDWEAERMATYAAQVEIMDRGIGSLLDALDAQGIRDDTLIVFTSDNGACAEELPFSPKGLSADASPPFTRGGRAVRVGNEPTITPGPEDGFSSYGRSWAHLSNTPFRLYKRWVHEGGIASPLIVSWPAGGVREGGIVGVPGHIVDIVPSIMDAVGSTGDGPGVSLLEDWRDPTATPSVERDLFWEHMGNAAVRRGRWKLVRESLRPWELYDLHSDRSETADLVAEHPDIARLLERAWQEWADANGVLAWQEVLADFRARGRVAPG